MISKELISSIDSVWSKLWANGISNPLTGLEQITYILFWKHLDEYQTKIDAGKIQGSSIFYGSDDEQGIRWRNLPNNPSKLFNVFRDQIFPFIRNTLPNRANTQLKTLVKSFSQINFLIPSSDLLFNIVSVCNKLDESDEDVNGDLYELLLSKLGTAKKNGQFRTPRHILEMIVQMMKPKSTDVICDPSSGSSGFLVQALKYMRSNGVAYNENTFNGVEIDQTMHRIGLMNMLQNGIAANIRSGSTLSLENSNLKNKFSLILANPPFGGSVDVKLIDPILYKSVKSKKTEILFTHVILNMLKEGGRAAVILPDGFMFGSNKALKLIRERIISDNKLEAVISLPSGVFKPYAGVATSILIFTKTNAGGTDKVWFYDMKADGFSLDDNRRFLGIEGKQTHEENNIPDLLNRFNNRDRDLDNSRAMQSFFVPFSDLQDNDYDLSINRYQEIEYEQVEYDDPITILNRIDALELDIQKGLRDLRKILTS